MKAVQIDEQLFFRLYKYFLLDVTDEQNAAAIRDGLQEKFDAMLSRYLYTQSKTAATPEEREAARQEYLDRKGVPDSFRWSEGNNPFSP